MKVGVFLSKRDNTEGGGYTITEELVGELIDQISKKKLENEFFFIVSNDLNNSICGNLLLKNIKFQKIIEHKLLRNFFIFISHLLPLSNKLLSFFNIFKINKIFKNEKCKKILFISSEYREKINLPYVATVWDMQHETHPQFSEVSSLGRKIYRKIVNNNFIKEAHTVIVGTNIGKSEVKKYTGFNKKFLVLPHPVSKVFLKKKTSRYRKKYNYFFYPANFWEHKNHINLIKAFRKFLKIKKRFKLILSGGKKNNYIKVLSLINKLKLSSKVKIVGYVSINKLINIYDNARAVIYPSFSGPENLPPIEALARKKILVNSLYPGAKEQLKNFPIYVNPNSPSNIANGMLKSLQFKFKKAQKLRNFVSSKSSKFYIEKLLKELL